MTDGLVAALARCQAKFPPIVKSHTNPAFKGSQYADIADVLAAVRPVLSAEGIAFTQSTVLGEDGAVALCTALMLGDEREESIFPLHIASLTPQGIGSLMTYIRRYQACSILGVHPVGDDDDGNAAQTAPAGMQAAAVAMGKAMAAIGPPDDWETRPLATMTFPELRAVAEKVGHAFSGGSKAELIRQLDPIVRAMSGDEPFDLTGAEPIEQKPDDHDKPFEPTVASVVQPATNEASGPSVAREALAGTERKRLDSAAREK